MNPSLIPTLALVETAPFLIPIVAIVMSLLIPIVAIISDAKKKRSIYELHHRERLAAIEKGLEIPPLPAELFDGRPRATGPGNFLLRGLIWCAVGIGVLIGLRELHEEASRLGIIPLLVGVAYLIYYALEGRKAGKATTKTETAPPSHP